MRDLTTDQSTNWWTNEKSSLLFWTADRNQSDMHIEWITIGNTINTIENTILTIENTITWKKTRENKK